MDAIGSTILACLADRALRVAIAALGAGFEDSEWG